MTIKYLFMKIEARQKSLNLYVDCGSLISVA